MNRALTWLATLVLAGTSVVLADALLMSKRYQFKPGVKLELGMALAGGIRIDTVQFLGPGAPAARSGGGGGSWRAEVAVSNTASVSRRVGIAIALHDDQGRLLGTASGGSRFLPLKPERQATYTLSFDDVNAEIPKATTFQISIEAR